MDTTKYNNFTTIIRNEKEGGTFVVNNKGSEMITEGSEEIKSLKPMRDIFLEVEDFEDAEVFYPSKMNEENSNVLVEKEVETKNLVQPFLMPVSSKNEVQIISTDPTPNKLVSQQDYEPSPFILANTEEVTLQHLKHDCIIPVFSKDNEKTIAHQEFIETAISAIATIFPNEAIETPEIRVSHQIKGRTPDAIHKNAKDLLDFDND